MDCNDIKPGLRVRTTELGPMTGTSIPPSHLACRKSGITGTAKSYVAGYGGDIWYVEHDDDRKVGAYCFTEIEPLSVQPSTTLDEQLPTVRIDERMLYHINVRDHGLPSMIMPGKMWRSANGETITCMVPYEKGGARVACETRKLEVVKAGERQVLPDTWRASLWLYVQAWPMSGCCYGPLLKITEAERCAFIRKLAQEIVGSDDIGCQMIAHNIGLFAAANYPLEFPEKSLDKTSASP